MLPSAVNVCQPCTIRLLKMSAPDASETDKEIMRLVREPKARNRARMVQIWVRSWHRSNCAPANELEDLRGASKVMRLKIARQEM